MNDSFVNALNTQKNTADWMDAISENLTNIYTPGYRETQASFKTFLNTGIIDGLNKNTGQGKSTPGTSNENVFLEGTGYFTLRRSDGQIVYSRLGEFTFDKEGVYKNTSGYTVQGYILNDKGEIMQGTKPIDADIYAETGIKGGAVNIPTTNIKLWIDPNNGKYLGKYDEFEFKGDGILYGKSDGGRNIVPLYKLAIMNFHNPEGLYEIKQGEFIETEESGRPVIGRGEVRGGLLEMSNCDFKTNISYYQQAKMQLDVANKLIQTNKQLLQEVLQLISS